MKLICDLCGGVLTENRDADTAVCGSCGMEYGPERLRELREAAVPVDPIPPTPPVPPAPPVEPVPEKNAVEPAQNKQSSGCGIWFLIIMAICDLVVGTHGIVAVFCLLIAWVVSRFSKKK